MNLELDKSHYISTLNACGLPHTPNEGKVLHEHISKTRFYSNTTITITLISIYISTWEALKLWTPTLKVCANVTWNVMKTMYANLGQSKEAFDCSAAMQSHGIKPKDFAYFEQ